MQLLIINGDYILYRSQLTGKSSTLVIAMPLECVEKICSAEFFAILRIIYIIK